MKSLAEANAEYYPIDFAASKEDLLESIEEQIKVYWQEVGMDLLMAVGGEDHYDDAVDGYRDLVMDRLCDLFYSNEQKDLFWEIRDELRKLTDNFVG